MLSERPAWFESRSLLLIALVLGCQDEGARPPSAANELSIPHVDLQLVGWFGGNGNRHAVISEVGGAVLLQDGRLFLALPQESRIVVHSAEGLRLAEWGTRGEGPGEFGALSTLTLRGDSLYAADDGNGRVSVFDLEGHILAVRPGMSPMFRRGESLHLPTAPQVPMEGGRSLLLPATAMDGGGEIRVGVTRGLREVPILLLDSLLSVVDTVGFQFLEGGMTVVQRRTGLVALVSPFESAPLVGLSPDGGGAVVVQRFHTCGVGGDSRGVRVLRMESSRDTVVDSCLSMDPEPLSEEVALQLAGEAMLFAEGQLEVEAPDRLSLLREAGLVPDLLPPVSRLYVDQDGRIWLRGREVPRYQSVNWTILNRDARPIASISLSAVESVVAGNGSWVATVGLDALEVPTVRIYSGLPVTRQK